MTWKMRGVCSGIRRSGTESIPNLEDSPIFERQEDQYLSIGIRIGSGHKLAFARGFGIRSR